MLKNKIKPDAIQDRIERAADQSEPLSQMLKYYTVAETAKLLRIGTRSVYALITAGELNAKKINKKSWCIFESDLIEFIKRPIPKIDLKAKKEK